MNPTPAPVLRITRRCLSDDLGLGDDAATPVEDLVGRHPIVSAFHTQRSQNPAGQEVVERLESRIVAWTLHGGEFRGATWHDEDAGIVWLLAARLHRSGEPGDAYPYFRSLDAAGDLLPTREDYLAFEASQARTLARALLDEAPEMRANARALEGTVCPFLLGGRISLRLLYEASDPPAMTIAISYRIRPGDMPLPEQWMVQVVAAFLGEDPEFSPTIGAEPTASDEAAFWAYDS